MVPLQVHNSLGREEERVRLSRIGRLIIGGGAVDSQLEEALRAFPNPIYSTYGMTETVSHIALRRINGKEASDRYTPLPGVGVTLSETGTLVINAPRISDRPVITNDIAEMGPDGTFRILGRSDNVINSGGIKIQIEAVEELLRPHIGTAYAVTSVPDPRLGEAMVLLVTSPSETSTVKDICARHLQRRQQPRHIFTVEKIPRQATVKPTGLRQRRWQPYCRSLPLPGDRRNENFFLPSPHPFAGETYHPSRMNVSRPLSYRRKSVFAEEISRHLHSSNAGIPPLNSVRSDRELHAPPSREVQPLQYARSVFPRRSHIRASHIPTLR